MRHKHDTPAPEHCDGHYVADGWYGGLPSHLTVEMTLAANRIRDVRVHAHATGPISLGYQRAFAEAVSEVVVGQLVSEADVGKLAGASGCPDGFNQALARIRAEAASTRSTDPQESNTPSDRSTHS